MVDKRWSTNAVTPLWRSVPGAIGSLSERIMLGHYVAPQGEALGARLSDDGQLLLDAAIAPCNSVLSIPHGQDVLPGEN
jgi:hypothetical protein